MISSVYNNKNRIPVNKQAVKEFFKDHEIHADHVDLEERPPLEIKIDYFKKATTDMLIPTSVDTDISVIDYERTAVALKKMQQNKPRKLSKLIRLIQHMSTCKKKYALLIIDNMCKQGFIKLTGDDVVYF